MSKISSKNFFSIGFKFAITIPANFFTILLDIRGSEISTEKLADFFNKKIEKGKNKFQFIIGGAFGVDGDLTNSADFLWKLSELTFNHQMVRIILLEQIYRVLSIINGESYHH
jgi:23S rRNA (pseudouridine1915-N3)-methyltransferase